jgi:hypothetical protein
VKNIQVIDAARNAVFDVFAATEDEFALIFPPDQDVVFIDEVCARADAAQLQTALAALWKRRIPKREVLGIHGTLFYEHEHKKIYYPTRRDEDAQNPDGTRLR